MGWTVLLVSGLLLALVAEFLHTEGEQEALRWEDFWSDAGRVARRVATVSLLGLGCFLGASLLAGRKLSVLFLRRFGRDVNAVLSQVIQTGFGRKFRIVALDDGKLPPLETPRFERWATRLLPVLGVLGLAAWLLSAMSQRTSYYHLPLDTAAVNLATFWLTFALAALGIGLFHLWRLEWRSRLLVETTTDVVPAMEYVQDLRRFGRRLVLLVPQLTVIRVVDERWREAVRSAIGRVDASVVDLSSPSENVLWEVRQVQGLGRPCVYIADRARSSAISPELRSLIAGQEVLLYDSEDRAGGVEFPKRLAAALRSLTFAEVRPPREPRLTFAVRHRVRRWTSRLLVVAPVLVGSLSLSFVLARAIWAEAEAIDVTVGGAMLLCLMANWYLGRNAARRARALAETSRVADRLARAPWRAIGYMLLVGAGFAVLSFALAPASDAVSYVLFWGWLPLLPVIPVLLDWRLARRRLQARSPG